MEGLDQKSPTWCCSDFLNLSEFEVFGCKVQLNVLFRRRFQEALVQSQVRFNRVPEKVPEKVSSQVQRVPEKVAEAKPGQVHLTNGNPAEVFPALGFAARFKKICKHKTLRLLGVPPKLIFLFFSRRARANGLCHWEGLCATAPFTAGGDCPLGIRASGRQPGSRRTAGAPCQRRAQMKQLLCRALWTVDFTNGSPQYSSVVSGGPQLPWNFDSITGLAIVGGSGFPLPGFAIFLSEGCPLVG